MPWISNSSNLLRILLAKLLALEPNLQSFLVGNQKRPILGEMGKRGDIPSQIQEWTNRGRESKP